MKIDQLLSFFCENESAVLMNAMELPSVIMAVVVYDTFSYGLLLRMNTITL